MLRYYAVYLFVAQLVSGQIKAILCSVYGMLHHYHSNHILHGMLHCV